MQQKTHNKLTITGGVGFIGSSSAVHFLAQGWEVTVVDNFSRAGVDANLAWLQQQPNANTLLHVIRADVRRDQKVLEEVVRDADFVLHLAAQVAVTTSVENPREDFESNALGTLNVLEAMRATSSKALLLYSSTNKVYGGLEDLPVIELSTRFAFKNLPHGVPESRVLDFHSPYGCSKGAADQYVRDYQRIYGIDTVVFRQSCIYGPHQFGVEDQGWIAWFLIALTLGMNITIYGTGKQVRDLLFIDDLIHAYELAYENRETVSGQIYNIGGGVNNAASIWYDLMPTFESLIGKKVQPRFEVERPGGQPIFISDIRKAYKDFGWQPTVSVEKGMQLLHDWVVANQSLIRSLQSE